MKSNESGYCTSSLLRDLSLIECLLRLELKRFVINSSKDRIHVPTISSNAFSDALNQNDAKSLLINCFFSLCCLGLWAFLQRSQSSISSGDHARTRLAAQAQTLQGRAGATLAYIVLLRRWVNKVNLSWNNHLCQFPRKYLLQKILCGYSVLLSTG